MRFILVLIVLMMMAAVCSAERLTIPNQDQIIMAAPFKANWKPAETKSIALTSKARPATTSRTTRTVASTHQTVRSAPTRTVARAAQPIRMVRRIIPTYSTGMMMGGYSGGMMGSCGSSMGSCGSGGYMGGGFSGGG